MDLQSQIDSLGEGELLELPAGQFELSGPLLLRRPMRLQGTATALVLRQGREAVVRIQGAGPFFLKGLRLIYLGEGPARVVWVESGEAHIEECHLSGARWVDDRGLGCGVHFSHESRGSLTFS